MGHYIDTSFLAPYLIPKPTSDCVEKKLQELPAGSLLISQWTRTEFASLLARRVRMKALPHQAATKVFGALDQSIRDSLIAG